MEGSVAERGSEQQTPPDVSEQVAALTQQVEQIGQRLPAPAEQPPAENLYESLYRQALADEQAAQAQRAQQAPVAEVQPQQQQGGLMTHQPDPNQQALEERAAFDHYVRSLVAGAVDQQVSPMIQSQGLEALEAKYEDIAEPEMVEAITDRLMPLAQRSGNEAMLTDPGLVEMAYLAERAARASASELPAEQAMHQGARLERGGASAPEGQLSPEDEIKRGILSAAGGKDAFT